MKNQDLAELVNKLNLAALVVSGRNGVLRTILVPAELIDGKFIHAVRDLFEYANQDVAIQPAPDFCSSLDEVESVFKEMNPESPD